MKKNAKKTKTKRSPNKNITENKDDFEILDADNPKGAVPRQLVASMSVLFQGPLPPPGVVRDYEEIVPGAADRIITMAEKEQKARHQNKRHYFSNQTLKISLSFVIVFAQFGAAIYLAFHEWRVAVALVFSGTVTTFLRGYFFNKEGVDKK